MTMVLDKVTNGPPRQLRSGTDDLLMWQEVVEQNEYGVAPEDVAGRTVLDVGAGVGAFAVKALEHGARMVVCVEPNHDTCCTLRRALQAEMTSGSVIAVEAGAWSCAGVGTLRLHHRGIRSGDTMVFSPPGEDAEVRTVDFAGLLLAFQPEAVKVDCEGSEYEILKQAGLPDCVRVAWVEFHDTGIEPWHSKSLGIMRRFSGWSSEVLKELPSGHRLVKFWR